MNLLHEIVDEASKLRTQRITLKEGKRPSFFTIKGSVDPKKFEPITPAQLDHLFTSIFAQAGDMLRHQRHARKFKILEHGEVDCIGLTDLRQINIYLASGAALYALDYAQFFPKSSLDAQQEDENASGAGKSSDTLIDAMVSLNNENSGIGLPSAAPAQENTLNNTPAQPPAQPPAAPENNDALRINLPGVNNDTPASEDSNNTLPAPTAAPSTSDSAIDLQPLLVATDKDEAAPAQEDTPAPQDVLQAPAEEDNTSEETGVHTAMHRVATQLDQVVAENDVIGEDDQRPPTSSPAPAMPQAHTVAQPLTTHTLVGTHAVSDGNQAIDKLLQEMMAKRASDLHLSCDHPIMMRISGQMEKFNADEKITAEILQSWLDPIIPALDAAKLEQSGDVDFTYELKGVGRFRVNVLKEVHGIGAVLRYVPAELKTLEELAVPEIVKKFCYLSKGLVIISGPAGSGRSTTMATMIDVINITRKAHLLSIEDPIEFVHRQKKSLIRQREVGTHTHSVREGLRAALREDPDIVCTDEIRDAEAMLMAMKCAEAGRLVFSMMHTKNSIAAIDSIINQFTPAQQNQARHLLANTLRGVICQTLVRKKSGGQVAAWEVLIASEAVAAMIKTGRTQQITAHMIAHRVKGNILLNDSLLKLVNDDTVSLNHALIAAADKRALHALAQRRGVKLSA